MGTSIVITSGKGGTGKTSVCCGVGSALAELGHRVLCIDMDIGLRNLDVMLGLTDAALMDFTDVIQGRCTLEQAACPHPNQKGLYLLNAPLSSKGYVALTEMQSMVMSAKFEYDYVLMDCPAGLGSGFRLAVCGADKAIVVTNTEPAALRDAQMTVHHLREYRIPIHMVVNKVNKKLMRRMETNIDDAMDAAGLPLIGVVPEDFHVPEVCGRGELVIRQSFSAAAKAYRNIALRITGKRVPTARI